MYLDILLILITIVYMLFGMKRGSVRMVYHAAARWGSIIIVCLLLNPVVEVMSTTDFAHDIYDGVYNAVESSQNGKTAVLEDMNDVIGRIATLGAAEAIDEATTVNADLIAVKVTTSVLKGMFFFILFIPVRLLFFVAYKILDSAARLPMVSSVNKLLGAIVGAANGLVLAFVLFKAAEVLSFFISFGFDEMLDGSLLVNALIGIV